MPWFCEDFQIRDVKAGPGPPSAQNLLTGRWIMTGLDMFTTVLKLKLVLRAGRSSIWGSTPDVNAG